MEFREYMDITIAVGGAVGFSAVVSRNVHTTIKTVTDKAIQITNDTDTMWLPKSALKVSKLDPRLFSLKPWYKKQLKGYDDWYLTKHSTVGAANSYRIPSR
jgi:hypothetical protein